MDIAVNTNVGSVGNIEIALIDAIDTLIDECCRYGVVYLGIDAEFRWTISDEQPQSAYVRHALPIVVTRQHVIDCARALMRCVRTIQPLRG